MVLLSVLTCAVIKDRQLFQPACYTVRTAIQKENSERSRTAQSSKMLKQREMQNELCLSNSFRGSLCPSSPRWEPLLFLLHYSHKKRPEKQSMVYTAGRKEPVSRGCLPEYILWTYLHGNFLILKEVQYLLCFIPMMLMPGPWAARTEHAQGKSQQLWLQKPQPCQHSS